MMLCRIMYKPFDIITSRSENILHLFQDCRTHANIGNSSRPLRSPAQRPFLRVFMRQSDKQPRPLFARVWYLFCFINSTNS